MSSIRALRYLAAAILWVACVTVVMAQVKTDTTVTKGAPSRQVTVERGEVAYVSGNELIVKMENGELRHFVVPDSARVNVEGKQLSVHELQPGMKLQRTITTTSTPKTIKTVRSGTGTVMNVMPPNSVTVRFEDGEVQQYKIPKGTTFTIDGEKKTAFDLRKGMKISATRIVEEPMVQVSEQKEVTGSMAPSSPPPEPPPQDAPLLIAEMPKTVQAAEPAPAPAAAPEPAPTKLPKTGSVVPLIGLLGLLFSGASFAMRMFRR